MGLVETAIIIGTVASAAGAGVSAYGSYQQGKAQRRMAEYNAKVAEANAKVAERDGREIANAQRRRNERILASQRASSAKSGVTGVGTSLIVAADQTMQLELDALETERQGEIQGYNLRQQAKLDRAGGNAAYKAGLWSAGGTLLSGAADVAGGISSYNKVKKPSTPVNMPSTPVKMPLTSTK